MNKFLLVSALLLFSAFAQAQKQTYQLIKEESGLAFYSKWVTLKGDNAGKQALFVKIVNKTKSPVAYSLGVEVFVDNIMVEQAAESEYCIRPKKTNQGKLNGIYFVSEKVTRADLASGKTVVELSDLSVRQTDICTKQK